MFVAVLTESLTEVVKNAMPNGVVRDRVTYAVSIVIGVVLSFSFDLNIFGLEGFGGYVAIVSAGLIASRGANFVNGFVKKVGIIKQ